MITELNTSNQRGIPIVCRFGYKYLACKPVDISEDSFLGHPLMEFWSSCIFGEQFIANLHEWRNPGDIIEKLFSYSVDDQYLQATYSRQKMIDVIALQLQDRKLHIYFTEDNKPLFSNKHLVSLKNKSLLPIILQAVIQEEEEINDQNVLSRKERYEQRKQLIKNTESVPELKEARERLDFNNDNIIRAEAAQYVYRVDEFNRGAIAKLPEAPEGLSLVDTTQIEALDEAVFFDKKTGFGSALFHSNINDETMLTYRGTNNAFTGKLDWITNAKQGVGSETDQYNQAMQLAEDLDDGLSSDFSIVGHSLGGGLASAGVGVSGHKGYTFNAAGLHPNTVKNFGGLNNDKISELMVSQSVTGEFLTGAQKYGNVALSAISGYIGNALGGPLGGIAAMAAKGLLANVPEALGEMKSLPGTGFDPIDRHGMIQVIAGIETQKDEDIKTLENYGDTYNGH